MEIKSLRYFATVVETGHLRNAAKLLGLAPGSLSKAMRALERDVGFRVLAPSGRGIVVTDRGLELYRQSLPLLREYGRLKEVVAGGGKEEGARPLRLGSFEVFTTYVLTRLIAAKFPDSAVVARELTPGSLEQALVAREVDLGLTYAPVPHEALDFLPVATFELGLFGKRERFGKTPWQELPFAVPVTPVTHHAAPLSSLDGWPEQKYPRRARYAFELLETALQTSRAGLSVLHCPRFIVGLHNQVVKAEYQLEELPLPAGMAPRRQRVYLVKRKGDDESGAAKKVAAVLRELCRPEGSRPGRTLRR